MRRKFFVRCLLISFTVFVSLEVLLRVIGFFYISSKFDRRDTSLSMESGSFRIISIGDSWTQGADALAGKGYIETCIKMIRKDYPDMKIESFNYAYGGFNSSEASLEFLKHYKEKEPDVLIILFGLNNIWNSKDIVLARKYFEKELGFWSGANMGISVWDRLLAAISSLKIAKLFRIACFNIFSARQDMAEGFAVFKPLPANEYTQQYILILGTGDKDRAVEYLIKNIESAPSYDDFYRMMLYSFDHRDSVVEDYLKKRGVWRPELIKQRLDQESHDSYVSSRYRLLQEQIAYLKQICDLHNIKMVLQNYPFTSHYTKEFNDELYAIAGSLGIPLLDHYELFEERLDSEGWKRILTYAHVNTEGYAMMAENLYNFMKNNGIFTSAGFADKGTESQISRIEKKQAGNIKQKRELVYKLHHSGNRRLAIRRGEEYLRLVPDDTDIWLVLAENYIGYNKLVRAETAAKEALELDPQSPWGLRVLSAIYRLKTERYPGQTEDYLLRAEAKVKHALRVAPDDPWVHMEAAEVYFAQGKIDKAVGAINKSLKLRPDEQCFLDLQKRILSKTKRR